MMSFKKDVYNAKIKNIEDKIPDITNLAPNPTLNAKINEVKNEIPSLINLGTTTAPNAKINEIKNKITITNLATTTALIAVENKIPNFSNLVKKKNPKKKLTITQKFVRLKIKLLLIMIAEKVKTISTKGLTKDFIICSIQVYYKIV